MKLAQHSYSGMFGTFLFNCIKDLSDQCVSENCSLDPDRSHENAELEEKPESLNAIRLFSVWDYLVKENPCFVNLAFDETLKKRLRCPVGVSEIRLWKEVYCCTDAEALINNPVICFCLFVHSLPTRHYQFFIKAFRPKILVTPTNYLFPCDF